MKISAFLMSCEDRKASLELTLASLRESGFPSAPELVLDEGIGERRLDRIHRTWRRLIRKGAEARSDFVLLLEDDLIFGRFFAENLASWRLLNEAPRSRAFFASLYNPSRPYVARRELERYLVADARFAWGAQAILTTPRTARYIDAHWDTAPGNPDQRMPRIAARVSPVYYHVPSLVDHQPVPTTWGGIEHAATDFDPEWRASA